MRRRRRPPDPVQTCTCPAASVEDPNDLDGYHHAHVLCLAVAGSDLDGFARSWAAACEGIRDEWIDRALEVPWHGLAEQVDRIATDLTDDQAARLRTPRPRPAVVDLPPRLARARKAN